GRATRRRLDGLARFGVARGASEAQDAACPPIRGGHANGLPVRRFDQRSAVLRRATAPAVRSAAATATKIQSGSPVNGRFFEPTAERSFVVAPRTPPGLCFAGFAAAFTGDSAAVAPRTPPAGADVAAGPLAAAVAACADCDADECELC